MPIIRSNAPPCTANQMKAYNTSLPITSKALNRYTIKNSILFSETVYLSILVSSPAMEAVSMMKLSRTETKTIGAASMPTLAVNSK